jgi:hypothetical protein
MPVNFGTPCSDVRDYEPTIGLGRRAARSIDP